MGARVSEVRDAGVRTARPAALPDSSRGTARSFWLHRGLLQPPPDPLGAGLRVAGELRGKQPFGLT